MPATARVTDWRSGAIERCRCGRGHGPLLPAIADASDVAPARRRTGGCRHLLLGWQTPGPGGINVYCGCVLHRRSTPNGASERTG